MAKQTHDYFATFAKQVGYAVQEADLLVKVVEEFTTSEAVADVLEYAHEIEGAADDAAHSNYNSVAIDFITPIDRDDIFELTHAMDSVVDRIEAVIQSFYITDVHFMHDDVLPMAKLIKRGCEELQSAMESFPNFKRNTDFREALMRVNDCEEEADRLYLKAVRRLHTEDADHPVRLLVWSRIFSSLETCCDAFEHCADLMGSIYIKNV